MLALLAACQSIVQDVLIEPRPETSYVPQSRISKLPPTKIGVSEFQETNKLEGTRRRIGERTAFGNQFMGYVWISPTPARILSDLIRSVLVAGGHQINAETPSARIDGTVAHFEVSTYATLLYWDVNGKLETVVNVTTSTNKISRQYAAVCSERTFIWPGTELITRVVASCLSDIARQFADDSSVSDVLSGRTQ